MKTLEDLLAFLQNEVEDGECRPISDSTTLHKYNELLTDILYNDQLVAFFLVRSSEDLSFHDKITQCHDGLTLVYWGDANWPLVDLISKTRSSLYNQAICDLLNYIPQVAARDTGLNNLHHLAINCMDDNEELRIDDSHYIIRNSNRSFSIVKKTAIVRFATGERCMRVYDMTSVNPNSSGFVCESPYSANMNDVKSSARSDEYNEAIEAVQTYFQNGYQ